MLHIVLLRMKTLIPKAVLINYVVNVESLITLLCELVNYLILQKQFKHSQM